MEALDLILLSHLMNCISSTYYWFGPFHEPSGGDRLSPLVELVFTSKTQGRAVKHKGTSNSSYIYSIKIKQTFMALSTHYYNIVSGLFPCSQNFSHLLLYGNLCLTELSCNINLSQKVPPNNKWCPLVRQLLFESSSYIL